MEKENAIKHNGLSLGNKESDQNEDDSILGSDELSDLRFSSQDNLLDSSQDGDNQCDVKWDYTSPQTLRQLRKMKGKYCAEDVKRIIATFPDLPVKSSESSVMNIRIMLPPKNAAAALEKSKQARAKQREMKLVRQRQKSKQVAKDMILFLHQEQHKNEKEAANKLKNPSNEPTTTIDKKCDQTDKNGDSEKLEDCDDFWSDDDLFTDNSFLIEATQYPERFFDVKNKNPTVSHQNNGKEGTLSNLHISKSDQCYEISTTSKHVFPFASKTSVSNHVTVPSIQGGHSGAIKTNFNSKGVAIPKTSSASGLSSGSMQRKPFTNSTDISTEGVPRKNVTNCDRKTSSRNVSSFPSHKNQASFVKSPFRKSLSFDAVNKPHKMSAPSNKLHMKTTHMSNQNRCTVASKTETKSISTSARVTNSRDQKQTAEQDLFDSSLSDELLLQATLSQEMAIKCGSSQPSVATETENKKKSFSYSTRSCYPSASSSFKPANCASNFGMKCPRKQSKGSEISSDILLSPVRPEKEDCEIMSQVFSKSPILSFSRKSLAGEKSAIPAHMAVKHRSSLALSSSTPVKCLRAQPNEDSFLERAFEDSFMNDEAVFESQILPMLERAESQVHKACSQDKAVPTTVVHSPLKCSPDEIEKKRQTAIQKRSLRLARMNHRKS